MRLSYNFFSVLQDFLEVSTLNVRSYPCHKEDIISDPIAVTSDVIVLTETWLNNNNADFSAFTDTYYIDRADKRSEHGGFGDEVAILAKCTAFTTFTKISSYADHLLQTLTCELKTISDDTIYVIAVDNSSSADNTNEHLGTVLLTILKYCVSIDVS
ncbi:hypothetical protein DPMN_017864 [Dreissena polymorpha]|uniref:Uncharacterized protein n=1 Tax=Dreissena polymorpha TaxID=45954 RepID=A0A9D4S5V8_DREPO|nr:hypothetical protein DPMN_017864 [Dreissena polymorpha]